MSYKIDFQPHSAYLYQISFKGNLNNLTWPDHDANFFSRFTGLSSYKAFLIAHFIPSAFAFTPLHLLQVPPPSFRIFYSLTLIFCFLWSVLHFLFQPTCIFIHTSFSVDIFHIRFLSTAIGLAPSFSSAFRSLAYIGGATISIFSCAFSLNSSIYCSLILASFLILLFGEANLVYFLLGSLTLRSPLHIDCFHCTFPLIFLLLWSDSKSEFCVNYQLLFGFLHLFYCQSGEIVYSFFDSF